LHDLLDEEVAERHALQAGLAIADRVEHGRRSLFGRKDGAIFGEDVLDGARHLRCERDFDEDQRLVDQ
jgi:hypothetical protein